jgi:ankyrin repeat protein
MLDPNIQGPFGNTLLHGAVMAGDRREVKRLLAAGANPNIVNREGRTALETARLIGRADLCELLAHGPYPDRIEQLLDQALDFTFPASDPIAIPRR